MTGRPQLTVNSLRLFLIGLVFATCTGSYAAAQEKFRLVADVPAPAEFDRWDYNVFFALPARISYELQEFTPEGELIGTYAHDDLEGALDQKDFLETRMLLTYRIVEVRHPQRWFFDGRHDTYSQAWTVAMNLRDMGLEYEIREVSNDWDLPQKR